MAKNSPNTVKLFIGPERTHEEILSMEEHTPVLYTQLWDDQTEIEYLERVKEQASTVAEKILQQAYEEEKKIKEKAYQEGYLAGEQAGKEIIKNNREEYMKLFSTFLNTIESYSPAIYKKIENELLLLLPLAIEKITGLVLEKHIYEIMEKTVYEAIRFLSQDRSFTITVHNNDAQIMKEILHSIQEQYPSTHSWSIRSNPQIPQGSCFFEDDINVIDISVEKRKKEVLKILSGISLPEDTELKDFS
ncbi:MAG: FliH/SctL family protein [Desulfovibrionaceae bacterium]